MMKKSLILSIIALLLFAANSFGNWQDGKENKTILIFLGLVPSQPAYRPLLAGIINKLTEEFGDGYILHTEYLETENYPKDNYPKERFDIYNEKYKDIELDLLICIGRNTISTLKKNASNYLLSLPAISIDFDFSDYGIVTDLRLNKHTALIAWKMDIDKTISTSLSLFPSTSSIYFIGGTTDWDRFLMMLAKEASKNIDKNKQINFISDISMDMVLQQVHNLPEGSIIFIPSFNTDSKKVTYYNPESVKLISLRANAPVFAYSDMGFGDGSVGGYILSFRKTGLKAGEIAVKILNGADPNSFIVNEKDYYEYIFDWRQLKRWNLQNSALLPAGSTVLFREVNLIEEYKWVIGVALLFLVLQTMLIANLIRLNRNQKLMTEKVIETENRYREFLHEDRSLRLGQLTASLSHELNQPLTAILSNAQAGINFINSNEATPDLLKQILQRIVDNDKRGASILSSIRAMMKLESRQKEKTDLNSLIQEVVDVFRSEARKQSIKIFVHMFNEPVYVKADRIQIQQVLLNLLFNASQSMQHIHSDKKAVDIFQTLSDDSITISVCDYGKGIDESIKDTIFKPFLTSKREGMGIGLSICRSIIEDHEGKIWVENKTDGGAKFSFSLKILKDG